MPHRSGALLAYMCPVPLTGGTTHPVTSTDVAKVYRYPEICNPLP